MPQSLNVKLELSATADFRVLVPDRNITVVAGTNADFKVSLDRLSSYAHDVNMTCSNLPSGATATYSDNVLSIGEATTLSVVTTGVVAGIYTISATGAEAPAEGNVVYAASPSSVDIQAAINAANDGDIVRVPAGDATWTSNVTVPSTKGIGVIGAGVGLTNITMGGYYLRLDTRPTNSRVRISAFRFINPPAGAIRINPDYTIGATNWRIDHCELTGTYPGATTLNCYGYTQGVVDHFNFINMQRAIWLDGRVSAFDTVPPLQYPGAYSWTQPIGGSLAVYFEDCTISNTVASIFFNMRGGARAVFRHNTMTGINGLETHSGCTPGFRNPRWIEIYENSFDLQGGAYWCGLFLRSLNGMIFNNTFSAGYPTMIRFDCETTCLDTCTAPWPTANKTVYPAQDQIGAGRDTGWATAQATDEAKLRIWNNTRGGVQTAASNTICAAGLVLMVDGRDYWQQVTPFTGTSGIGVGLLSARPSSGLTVGVGYWATDTNTLYRATSATIWETLYAPYAYPHPVTLL